MNYSYFFWWIERQIKNYNVEIYKKSYEVDILILYSISKHLDELLIKD